MGVVDLAVDENGRQVALKRLALHGSAQDIRRARLRVRREASALASVDHPGIVGLLDVIDDGDDLVLVMPFLGGGTLTDRVHRFGPLSPDQVHLLADNLLDALAAAHRAGIVHRDLKPANVLFGADGRPYLADFGVATMRDATSGLTATEMVVGTPEFMAPEQARGEPATAASDVFSMGATLRYAAVGTPPYGRGDPRVILHRAAEGKIERLPASLPKDLRERLAPFLDRRPDRRPTAAAARGGAGHTRVHRRPGRAARRPVGTRRWPAAAAIVVIALVGLGATAITLAQRNAPPEASPSTTSGPTTAPAPPCTPLTYQPCGGPAAPFTNGVSCTDSHADYDGVTTNGCEAAPDKLNGTRLTDTISANLVPGDALDRYPFHLSDHFQLLCDGAAEVTLTAPAGVSLRLEILQGTTPLATSVSTDATPATVTLDDPDCLRDDSADLVARVSWVGSARSAAPYRLTRHGTY